MKKVRLLILIIGFSLLIIADINPVFAVMESENYRIQEESVNFGETGQKIDAYQLKSGEAKSKEESEKGFIAGLQIIGFQLPLWKIILLGLAGAFLIATFFVWLGSVFKIKKKTYNK